MLYDGDSELKHINSPLSAQQFLKSMFFVAALAL